MKKIQFVFGLMLVWAASVQSQTMTIQTLSNYNQWGWEAVVMQNGLITVATVPAIGARVMQYDLGDHPSIFVNPAELTKTYTPNSSATWHNFGGFKNWPDPDDKWNGWPPPPTLDCGAYSFQILSQTADSIALRVVGPTEKWLAPNIHFERTAVIYPGTSRVKMEQTLVNDGSAPVEWGIWDITQCIVNHPGEKDYENFWVYFPFSENSVFGDKHVKWSASSKAWKGEVAPGVYGVQFLAEGKKIFADAPEGWICYADQRDGYIYAKTFEIYSGAEYPNGGATVETWINNDPLYLEVEVMGPVEPIPANGGKTTFTEDWWAAKVRTPVLDVNTVGAIAQKMAYNEAAKTFSGIYGVFYRGTVRIAFLNGERAILSEGQSHAVTPLEEFQLQESVEIPAGAQTLELRLFDTLGNPVGVLESAAVSQITGILESSSVSPADFRLEQNYPNPFNGSTVLTFLIPTSSKGSLKVYDIHGSEIATLTSGIWEPGMHRWVWNPAAAASGVYVVKLEAGSERKTLKMLYLR